MDKANAPKVVQLDLKINAACAIFHILFNGDARGQMDQLLLRERELHERNVLLDERSKKVVKHADEALEAPRRSTESSTTPRGGGGSGGGGGVRSHNDAAVCCAAR